MKPDTPMLKHALVVTSISELTPILKDLRAGAETAGWTYYFISDKKGPLHPYRGCWSIRRQEESCLRTALELPFNNYSRKNVGYLLAMQGGAEVIVETDDDNRPLDAFWKERIMMRLSASQAEYEDLVISGQHGWVNALQEFAAPPADLHEFYNPRTGQIAAVSKDNIWPRGFPLEFVNDGCTLSGIKTEAICPIQQGIIEKDPDVDAIQRLTSPVKNWIFDDTLWLILKDQWCPFNSQNTTWFREAFPLMYLPSYCKGAYRMNDIWRSFIAQRIAFENGWSILWGGVSVEQERNPHDLMLDFEEELIGYLNNARLVEMLKKLPIVPGTKPDMLLFNVGVCYLAMIEAGFVEPAEMDVFHAWCHDCTSILRTGTDRELTTVPESGSISEE
jgi:hypothetical protein